MNITNCRLVASFLILSIVLATLIGYWYMNSHSGATPENTSSYYVASAVRSVPSFSFTYPTQWGTPTVTWSMGIGSVIFYKQHSSTDYILSFSVWTEQLSSGQTIGNFVDAILGPNATRKTALIDNHNAVLESLSSNSPVYLLFIQLDSNTVLRYSFVIPEPMKTTENVEMIRELELSIIQSLRFSGDTQP